MKIGIIGFGNVGGAVATGFVKQGIGQDNILVSDKSDSAVKKAHILGINNTGVDTLVEKSDIIFLCVSRDVYENLDITPSQVMGKTIISCISNVNMNELSRRFGTQIVRAIPNLAVENINGVIGVCFDEYADNKDDIKNLLSLLGYVHEGTEDDLAKISSVSTCGLCYAAFIMNSFTETAENLGFSHDEARKIVKQTFNALNDVDDYELLMGRIATRGGFAIQGIEAFEEGNVSRIIDSTLKMNYAGFLKN